MKSLFIRLLLLLLTVTGVFYFLSSNQALVEFEKLSIQEWLLISLVAWIIMIFTTFLTFKIRLRNDKFRTTDLLTYPLVQSLWGYIIPIQGSIIFSVTYFKRIYQKSTTESVSINLLFVLISLIAGGIIGLLTLILSNRFEPLPYVLFLTSLFTGIVPFLVGTALITFLEGKIKNQLLLVILSRITLLKKDLSNSVRFFMRNPILITTFLGRIILLYVWYYIIANSLNLGLSIDAGLLFIFFSQSSTLLKFTPGNWGSQQAVVGILFGLIGLKPNDAVLISTISMLSTVALSFSIGLISNFYYLRRFNIENIFNLIKK